MLKETITKEYNLLGIDWQELFQKGDFILGPEVAYFEKEFSKFCGCKYGVGVGSGSDALFLSLKTLGIGKGDEVIVPALTAMPTVNAVLATGASPKFADIDEETYNIDVDSVKVGNKVKAIIPVHLYGNPCDMRAVKNLGIPIVEDACQAHGAEYKGKKVGSFGKAGCFSFYPTKNLGCYGDGGMIVTNDKEFAEKLKIIRNCGCKDRVSYEHVRGGFNSRLDELQAFVLRKKLKLLPMWNAERIGIAEYYNDLIDCVITPESNGLHVYHQYVVRVKGRNKLASNNSWLVHYPKLCTQHSFMEKYVKKRFPVAEKVVKEIVSLPIHHLISLPEVFKVVEIINKHGRTIK